MQYLKTNWRFKSSSKVPGPGADMSQEIDVGLEGKKEILVVAHFMLGNTYSYEDADWLRTFELARGTWLDGLVLNLGNEEWQVAQAIRAYSLLSIHNLNIENALSNKTRHLRLFLSLDMNVQPPNPHDLAERVVRIINSGIEAQMMYDDKVLLSTFSGHSLGNGWVQVKRLVQDSVGREVFFWPAFFIPPREFIQLPYVDGTFAWNNAWPMGNHTTNLDEDLPFLESDKPYMAAVSPLFFTHYGTKGEWAFNKNWIYRSDDLLLPNRFQNLLSVPQKQRPSIIQLISWNDYGESHYISPIGSNDAQPGSEGWTSGMNHEGFRWIVRYFARRCHGYNEVDAAFDISQDQDQDKEDGFVYQLNNNDDVGTREKAKAKAKAKVVLWYRSQAGIENTTTDSVGKPKNAEWAQDLINIFVVLSSASPSTSTTKSNKSSYSLIIQNGNDISGQSPIIKIKEGLNIHTLPSQLGRVRFTLIKHDNDDDKGHLGDDDDQVMLSGEGKEIAVGEKEERWNYNFWSGVWSI